MIVFNDTWGDQSVIKNPTVIQKGLGLHKNPLSTKKNPSRKKALSDTNKKFLRYLGYTVK